MKIRKFGALAQTPPEDASAPVSVQEIQGRLLSMFFPVRVTGTINDNTVSGLGSYMRQLGIDDLNVRVSQDQRSATLSPASILTSLRETSALAMRLVPRLPPAGPGTWGSVLVRYFQARNMIPIFNQSMSTAISGGTVTPEIRARYERMMSDLDAIGTKIATWIEGKPEMVSRLNQVMGQVAGSNAQAALNELKTPLPRVVTVDSGSLGALPVVALVVGVCVIAVAVAVPVTIYEWNKPAILQAEAELLRAEAELEALRVVDRGLARGLTPEEINVALNGVTELRGSRPQPSSSFPWGLTVGLLLAAGVGFWFWKNRRFRAPEGDAMLPDGDDDEVIEAEIIENPKPLPPLSALLPENV